VEPFRLFVNSSDAIAQLDSLIGETVVVSLNRAASDGVGIPRSVSWLAISRSGAPSIARSYIVRTTGAVSGSSTRRHFPLFVVSGLAQRYLNDDIYAAFSLPL
jgi:hypothetical protein